MITVLRTHQLKPGALPDVDAAFARDLDRMQGQGRLAGAWRTEVGVLNQIVSLWTYPSRSAAESEPPHLFDSEVEARIVSREDLLLEAAPFNPPLEPASHGEFYEARLYTYAEGAMPDVIERWGAMLPERVKMSAFIGAWQSVGTAQPRWLHIWAYKDYAHRQAVRGEAVAKGIWPPKSAPGSLLLMTNQILVPTAFSPLR